MKDKINYCSSCAFRSQNGDQCGLTGIAINPSTDFCSKFKKSPDTCDICGHFIVDNAILEVVDGITHMICQNCCSHFGTCVLCDFNGYCDFQENPIQIPPVVQKRVQQGPMTIMTQVMNPERIKETCEKNCGCFDPEFGCLRQSGQGCGKNKYTYK